MSTYSYQLVLDDSEAFMLEAAVKFYIEKCNQELSEGPKAPYWAHKHTAEGLLLRLYQKVTQSSGNNFSS